MKALSKQLATYWIRQDVDSPQPTPRMTVATHDVLLFHSEALDGRMSEIESASDAKGIHRARIAAKRLRYVLEPLSDEGIVASLVQQLAALQAVLGAVHDSHRVSGRLIREVG